MLRLPLRKLILSGVWPALAASGLIADSLGSHTMTLAIGRTGPFGMPLDPAWAAA
jgi:hypothetical protein